MAVRWIDGLGVMCFVFHMLCEAAQLLTGFHANLLDDRARFGRSEELHQRPGCVRRRRLRVHACRIDGDVLYFGSQWPEVIDALHMKEVADLLEP